MDELHSSLLKRAIPFPQHIKSHRQVLQAATTKQCCPLGPDGVNNQKQLVRTADCEDLPPIDGRNALLAVMDYNMFTHEDAAVISSSLAKSMVTYTEKSKTFIDVDGEIQAMVREEDTINPHQSVGLKSNGEPCMMGNDVKGRVIGVSTYQDDVEGVDGWYLDVTIECEYQCGVGSKLCNMHSCKSIVSKILPDERMPQMLSGTPIDMMISPMSIGNRVNPSLLLEGMLGMYCKQTGKELEYEQFSGDINFKIASEMLYNVGIPRDCKYQLKNGARGKEFPHKTFVGNVFLMRLNLHAEDKLSWQNDARLDHTGLAVTGIGNTKYGREEIEILYQHGCDNIIDEIITNSSKSQAGSLIRELVKVIGYEYKFK